MTLSSLDNFCGGHNFFVSDTVSLCPSLMQSSVKPQSFLTQKLTFQPSSFYTQGPLADDEIKTLDPDWTDVFDFSRCFQAMLVDKK